MRIRLNDSHYSDGIYGRTLSERPCYIMLMLFYIFYARLSWPNG